MKRYCRWRKCSGAAGAEFREDIGLDLNKLEGMRTDPERELVSIDVLVVAAMLGDSCPPLLIPCDDRLPPLPLPLPLPLRKRLRKSLRLL